MKKAFVQKLIGKSGMWIKRNSSTLLTFVSMAGVVGTIGSVMVATPKALKLIEEAKKEKGEDLTKFEVIKTTAIVYIPSAVLCTTTLACILCTNVLNRKHQAALTGAYALIDSQYKKYREKVKELYGENADREVKDREVKDTYNDENIAKSDSNKLLYYDDFSERYFEADELTLVKAEYEINRAFSTDGCVSLAYWYELIGLPVNMEAYHYIGWTYETALDWTGYDWLDFTHHKVVMDDGLEVIVVYTSFEPSIDYMDEFLDIPDNIRKEYGLDKDETVYTECGVARLIDNSKHNL